MAGDVSKEWIVRERDRVIPEATFRLGPESRAVEDRLRDWKVERVAERLWDRDPTLWSADPLPELVDRLGWLELPETMSARIPELDAFGAEVAADGTERVVLLGMGGSSLAAKVFSRTMESTPGRPRLEVVDSTHPAAVSAAADRIDPGRTLFVVSSKSGTTLETLSLFRLFWARTAAAFDSPGSRFCAITDPGTPLAELGRERGFRRVFHAPPDLGGRYSALSPFGLVPAALIGVDLERLLGGATAMADACRLADAAENPGLRLGATLGELALAGRDKVTLRTAPEVEAFTAWLEQLIAESTGKAGRGILPVAGEAARPADSYGDDRLFIGLAVGDESPLISGPGGAVSELSDAGHPTVELRLNETEELGGEMFRWEVAVALAGAALGIHPFNQPDVQLAKELARAAMQGDTGAGVDHASRGDRADDTVATDAPGVAAAVAGWLEAASPGGYLAIQVFLPAEPETSRLLDGIRSRLGRRTGLATTLGFGPRFLHSTGQLHKGGPAGGLFLQLVDEPTADVAVPETGYTFGELIRAQALGDYAALRERERRVLRVSLGTERIRWLERLDRAVADVG